MIKIGSKVRVSHDCSDTPYCGLEGILVIDPLSRTYGIDFGKKLPGSWDLDKLPGGTGRLIEKQYIFEIMGDWDD